MQEWREVDEEEDRGGGGWMMSRKILQVWEWGIGRLWLVTVCNGGLLWEKPRFILDCRAGKNWQKDNMVFLRAVAIGKRNKRRSEIEGVVQEIYFLTLSFLWYSRPQQLTTKSWGPLELCIWKCANPLRYYVLRVPRKVDRWHWVWSIFNSRTAWAEHIMCGTSICIVYWR